MSKIIDLTNQQYPNLVGAEYLKFESEEIPAHVEITKSNVVVNGLGELKTSPFGSYWGWESGNSFNRNFQTPEEALNDYLSTLEYFSKNKKPE